MSIFIDWKNKIINIPKSFMSLVQSNPEIRELDLDELRLALKDIEDSEEGMSFLDTHRHNTEVTMGGVTLARVLEFINGYTVTFEDGTYAVNAIGANSNIGDVMNVNQVSLRTFNSTGLVMGGSGVTQQDKEDIVAMVLDATLSEHQTTDSVGKTLVDIKKKTKSIEAFEAVKF